MTPKTDITHYFVDKCLPFGSSISCAHFQAVSDAIAYVVKYRTKEDTLNYLDDYFFAAFFKYYCDWQVNQFTQVCKEIRFPVSLEKTFRGTTLLTFLGFLIDTERQLICIPVEKIQKALELIEVFRQHKKVTVHQIQKLCGFLNFLCRAIILGNAFTRRFYALTSGLKPHYHIRLKEENKLDLDMWFKILTHPDSFYRPFMELVCLDASEIDMYSDASRAFSKGFGAWCQNSWTCGNWNYEFMESAQPSIEYLELYGVAIAVKLWIQRFRNRRIYLFCDNESVVYMLNHSSSKCKNCMVLIRIITLHSMIHNVRVFAKHVGTKDNGIADALSRFNFSRFDKLRKKQSMALNVCPDRLPEDLWPMQKIWLN